MDSPDNIKPTFGKPIKRGIDILVSSIALLILSPFFILIGIAIKLFSPGPSIYRWAAVGHNGRPFNTFKFRSMILGADELKQDLLDQNEASGVVFKIKDDPRIFPFGRILRKFSIDELPQLWSVLKGDMSLIGPRPVLPSEWAEFTSWQKTKLNTKPGAVSLWHVRGQPRDLDEWVKLDLEYIDNWSLWLDAAIFIRALGYIITGKNQ